MPRPLSLIALSLVLTACMPEPPLIDGPARPALWLIEDADTRMVLLGSVHQLPPDLDWQGGELRRAIASADELILELAPAELANAPTLFAAMAADEPVASLDRRFGQPAAERVRDFIRDAGLDPDDADDMESWALALVIGRVITADLGLSNDNGVEARMAAAFAGRRITGLETAAAQLAMFDALPDPAQNAMVSSGLATAATARDRMGRLLTAWADGNSSALAAAAAEAMVDTPALVEPVLLARNRAWAAALAARMDRPGSIVVAVGAGHLVGRGSVIEELDRRGFTAQRLQ